MDARPPKDWARDFVRPGLGRGFGGWGWGEWPPDLVGRGGCVRRRGWGQGGCSRVRRGVGMVGEVDLEGGGVVGWEGGFGG